MLQFQFYIFKMEQFVNLSKHLKSDTIYIYIVSAHKIGQNIYIYFVCSQNWTKYIYIFCLLTNLDTIYIYKVSGHLKYFCNCVFGHNLPDIDMCCRNFFNEKGIYYRITVFLGKLLNIELLRESGAGFKVALDALNIKWLPIALGL